MNQFNFGIQPLSNRYIEKSSFQEKEFKHPLILVQDHLGLVRIKDPIPYNEMNPKFDWLTETEPADHLNTVSAIITDWVSQDSCKTLGLSYRDGRHAEILSDKFGVTQIDFIDYQSLTSDKYFKIETIQHLITEKFEVFLKVYGKFDFILANRILHHAHDPLAFLSGISNMLTEEGFIYFEVPDCQRGFIDLDYTILFEEHTLYFTKNSLCNLLEHAGYEIQWCFEYMYPVENSLSILVKKRKNMLVQTETNINFEQQYFSYFVEMFNKTRHKVQKYFKVLSKKNRICLFGAGHHGTTFINLFNLSQYFEFVVDDNEMKQEYLLPGTNLEIVGSLQLDIKNIDYCFLSVSQVNENRLIRKISCLSNSVKCFSIFPKSLNTFPLDISNEDKLVEN
jgi:2-polyprenyl-3-methyl-5-hydroxy-6-metoxy-1,4-benzoquinol methylase